MRLRLCTSVSSKFSSLARERESLIVGVSVEHVWSFAAFVETKIFQVCHGVEMNRDAIPYARCLAVTAFTVCIELKIFIASDHDRGT